MSGVFYRGMVGAGAAIDFTVPAPLGVDLTAVAKSMTATVVLADGSSAALAAWSFLSVTPTSMTARLVPVGTEFSVAGPMVFHISVTLGGVLYRYRDLRDEVRENP